MEDPVYVAPAQLAIGMFVILELSWLQHPFSFSSFLVQNEDQLATLRRLGLRRIRIDPLRSKRVAATIAAEQVEQADLLDLPESSASPESPEPGPTHAPTRPVVPTVADPAASRSEHHRRLCASIASAERQAAQAAQVVRQTTARFLAEPTDAIARVNDLVTGITDSLLGVGEVMVHLLGEKDGGDELYHHSLNVAVLALILGKAMAVDVESLRLIGVSAIFHDLGMVAMTAGAQLQCGALAVDQEAQLRQHCEAGARMALQCGLPETVATVLLQHHEHLDGSGYPYRLSGDQIGQAARVVAIANHYDHLCNANRAAAAVTPYEALSTMFARQKHWFDAAMLARLVRVLGVYPPGSLVQLSSGAMAMVISANAARPLRPMLLVHDPAIPREEALILDLEQAPEISISKALRASALAPAEHEYLCPGKRVAYFFGEDTRTG